MEPVAEPLADRAPANEHGGEQLSLQVAVWLTRASNAAISAQAEALRPLGLSVSGFNVLLTLLNTPGHTLEPWQLAERLQVSRPSITGLLDTLEAKRLVTRRPHRADRRRVLVTLSKAGEQVLARHCPTHHRRQAALFAALCAEEQAELVRLLRLVAEAAPPTVPSSPA